MKTTTLGRSVGTWLAAFAVSGLVATGGAFSVLADPADPACLDNDPATMPQDGSGCEEPVAAPAPPADPAPAPEPEAPAEPAPAPAPAPETPAEPAPAPEQPATPAPAPTPPAAPETPAEPTDPPAQTPDAPVETPDTPAPTNPTKPDAPKPDKPSKPEQPQAPAPAPDKPADQPAAPDNGGDGGEAEPAGEDATPDETVSPEDAEAAARAQIAAISGNGDARTFRESYTPKDVLPELPRMDAETAKAVGAAATATGADWSAIATLAWLDSRWGTVGDGPLVGADLTSEQWDTYGTDGDDDGKVLASSDADAAATVGAMIAELGVRPAFAAYTGGQLEFALVMYAYYDALGPVAVQEGLEQAQEEIQARVLADKRIDLYPGGRGDVAAGLVDPRVLVALEFLANRYDSVGVSSLITGHGVFTTAGNVSNHAYGRAVDIYRLGKTPILGNQQRDSVTVHAVKDMLAWPKQMATMELITLWTLGGPSFGLSDHHDHIHVGFADAAASNVPGVHPAHTDHGD